MLRRPTFTAFLAFAAQRNAPARLAFAPLWVMMLIGYRLGLYGRKRLKQWGLALFLGRHVPQNVMSVTAEEFAASLVPADVAPGAAAALDRHRKAGDRILIATAAPEFYVRAIADRLGIEDIVATRHFRGENGDWSHRIDGANCYGADKLAAIVAWLEEQKLVREQCRIVFYSDHASDRPVFDWADRAILVGGGEKGRAVAQGHGWEWQDFDSPLLAR